MNLLFCRHICASLLFDQIVSFPCLTGTKIDLRDDRETLSALSEQGLSPLKREQGQKLANKIRAVKYMECSALTQRGLKQVCSAQTGPPNEKLNVFYLFCLPAEFRYSMKLYDAY